MRRSAYAWKLVGCAIVAVLLATEMSGAPASAQAAQLSSNVRAGGIDSHQREQVGSRIHRSRAVGLVHATVARVTDVILDYAGYRHFMPNFVASRVLSKRGGQAMLYIEVSALQGLATLWAQMKMHLLPSTDPTRVILASMVKGNLKRFEAEWQITPVTATQTLVAFELCADPNFPLPFASGIVSDYNEEEARRSVLALRNYLTTHSPAAQL